MDLATTTDNGVYVTGNIQLTIAPTDNEKAITQLKDALGESQITMRMVEEALIKCLIKCGEHKICTETAHYIKPEMFQNKDLKAVYEAVLSLVFRSDPVVPELVSVTKALDDMGLITDTPNSKTGVPRTYVLQLFQKGGDIKNISLYASAVFTNWMRGTTKKDVTALSTVLDDRTKSLQEIGSTLYATARSFTSRLQQHEKSGMFLNGHDTQRTYLDRLTAQLDKSNVNKIKGKGATFGFPEFDGNIYESQVPVALLSSGILATIMGAPGGGKSGFMETVAENNALNGRRVLYALSEYNVGMFENRKMARHTGINYNKLDMQFFDEYRGKQLLNDDEIACIVNAVEYFSRWPSTVDYLDISQFPFDMALNYIEGYVEQMGGYNLIVVDYLQRVIPPAKLPRYKDNQASVLGSCIDMLGKFANKMSLPILLGSQTQRMGGQRIKMDSGLGTGDIERYCQIIAALEYLNPDLAYEATCTLLKNNMGASDQIIKLWYNKPRFLFMPIGEGLALEEARKQAELERQENNHFHF